MRKYRGVRAGITAVGVSFALIGVVGATLVGSAAARADTPGFYNMTASANSASIEVDAANAPLFAPQLLFVSPGTAQSQLNSYGGSSAFAGAPFFGQTIEGVGGLVDGLGTGVLPPIPQTLPGYVTTSSPSVPSANASQGPYTLDANSTATSSNATAGIAAVAGQPSLLSSTATAATVIKADGSLESAAQVVTEPFGLGSLLQIGTLQATADMTVDANGNLTQTSSFDLGTITIAGIKVGLTQNGLQLIGSTLPLANLTTLNTLLKSAGVSLQLLPALKSPTSITSEGLQITISKSIPVEGVSGLIVTLGQATVQLAYQTETSGGVTPTTEPLADNESSGTVPDAITTPQAVGIQSPTSSSGGSGPQALTPSSPPTTSISSAKAAGTTLLEPTAAQLASSLGPDGLKFYLTLLASGIALIVASRLASLLAIGRRRTRWKGST